MSKTLFYVVTLRHILSHIPTSNPCLIHGKTYLSHNYVEDSKSQFKEKFLIWRHIYV